MTKLSTQAQQGKGEKDEPVYVTVDQLTKISPRKRVPRQGRASSGICLKFACVLLVALTLVAIGAIVWIQVAKSKQRYTKRCTFVLDTVAVDEQVEVFKDDDRSAISVPKFDDNDQATFMHDFRLNISIIKDYTDGLCYILPLDRTVIPQPRDLWDFIVGIQTNEYILKADKIQSGYKVVHPELSSDELKDLYGSFVATYCAGYPTYHLEVIKDKELTTTTMATFIVQAKFVMYPGGQAMLSYIIYR